MYIYRVAPTIFGYINIEHCKQKKRPFILKYFHWLPHQSHGLLNWSQQNLFLFRSISFYFFELFERYNDDVGTNGVCQWFREYWRALSLFKYSSFFLNHLTTFWHQNSRKFSFQQLNSLTHRITWSSLLLKLIPVMSFFTQLQLNLMSQYLPISIFIDSYILFGNIFFSDAFGQVPFTHSHFWVMKYRFLALKLMYFLFSSLD